jgi:hypothetical protein
MKARVTRSLAPSNAVAPMSGPPEGMPCSQTKIEQYDLDQWIHTVYEAKEP